MEKGSGGGGGDERWWEVVEVEEGRSRGGVEEGWRREGKGWRREGKHKMPLPYD